MATFSVTLADSGLRVRNRIFQVKDECQWEGSHLVFVGVTEVSV